MKSIPCSSVAAILLSSLLQLHNWRQNNPDILYTLVLWIPSLLVALQQHGIQGNLQLSW